MTRQAWLPPGGRRWSASQVRAVLRAVRWYVHALMGDDAYQRYLAHLAVAHPGVVPPSERQFWRDRYAEQETRPATRCC